MSKDFERFTTKWGSLGNIIFQAIFLGAANFLYDKLPFINAEVFETFLPLINITGAVIIILHSINLSKPSKWMKSIAELGSTAVSVIITWNFLQNYPFQFNEWISGVDLDGIFRILMILGVVGGSIGFIVQFAKSAWLYDHEDEANK